MTVVFSQRKSVSDLGAEVINSWHPHLIPVRVEFVLRDNIPTGGGKEVWGRAKKITGMAAFLADHEEDPSGDEFFVIDISAPVWDRLTAEERLALIDHELCHCAIEIDEDDADASIKLKLKPHDLEEFRAIVERHGLWRKDVEEMAGTFDAVLEA